MLETADTLKLRIMLCFLQSAPKNCTVTGISKTLGEEKYKISRMMIAMEKEGLLDRSEARAPVLTKKGMEEAIRYNERINVSQNHLLYEGMDIVNAKRDACTWAMYCSDELMDVIRESDERYRVKNELREQKNFSGSTLCKRLKDGIIHMPESKAIFTILI